MVVTRSRASAVLRHTSNPIGKRRSLRLLDRTLAPPSAPSPPSAAAKRREVKKPAAKKKLKAKKATAKRARAEEFEPRNHPCSKPEPVDVRTPGHEQWNYANVNYDSEPEVTSPFMGTLWQSKVPISRRLHESPIRYAAVEPVPVVVDEVAFASTVVSGVGSSCTGAVRLQNVCS
ncbi:hypothetical protein J5N97_009228 [Dioscorea zingiberensis]|uniref:Uncharacterized protein n=1 Tax=Dioscorea zingiberensis TaxID=325984 RepID=A0A9D5HLL2_9LILI|nr:hypothetical protein J5N97_009228 [Dioscorea zingiberensis]